MPFHGRRILFVRGGGEEGLNLLLVSYSVLSVCASYSFIFCKYYREAIYHQLT
jgi:hypothetical protein